MPTPDQLRFFALTARYDDLTSNGNPLEPLAQHFPWARFRKPLEKSLCGSKRYKGCCPPFETLVKFKILVLQALYNLPDDQKEYQIPIRLSFIRFLVLELHKRIPVAKAICLFRKMLNQAGMVDTLFAKDTYRAGQEFQACRG